MSTDTKPRARLGRGLSSLIGSGKPAAAPATTAIDATKAGGLTHLSVDAIEANPYQPRQQFEPRSLERLAESIKTDGLLQPLVVRPKPGTEGRFELIAGERRWRAAKLAGLTSVPVVVREPTDRELAELALIENLQREDLNPIDRAEAFRQLIDRYQLSHDDVAGRVGVERSTITNALRLLALQPQVQQLVRDGLLSAGQARAIASVPDGETQCMLAIKAVKQGWSVRQVEQEVRDVTNPPSDKAKTKARRGAHLADLEKQLSQQLGTKVSVKQGRKRGAGTLTINFYSLEQFDDLLQRLGVKTD